MSEVIVPYTASSFSMQSSFFKKKLKQIGVPISFDDSKRITFLSRRKYDRYDHFAPGENFMTRLISWLQINFKKNERETAFSIVKNIKFIDQYELRELTTSTFENIINNICLSESYSSSTWYSFIESIDQKKAIELSHTIFVACADDIRFDYFRRYAMNRFPNSFKKDHFIEYYKLNKESQKKLPFFNRVVLLDHLAASGTTAIRKENIEGVDIWSGKFPRFFKLWADNVLDVPIYYCPYILSNVAETNIKERLRIWKRDESINNEISLLPTSKISTSPCIANDYDQIDLNSDVALLCERYYSLFKEDIHTEKVGGRVPYGYGDTGLTLVFQSNCPNNTLPLLWHSYNGWYPLFPRISHHR